MSLVNHFDKIDIRVFDRFIEKFADRYIRQRSELFDGISEDVLEQAESTECGFDLSSLLKVIRQNSVAPDLKRDNGGKPLAFKDIYRSDLGELLTTYYFEEKISEDRRFLIPIKNISYRERFDLPGRGFDAIGYRTEPDKVNVLIGEAKVSSQKENPPHVVDKNDDSIYMSQKSHHDNTGMVLQRLTDYLRRLPSNNHFLVIAGVVINMEKRNTDRYDITYGCGLVRDSQCVDETKDFGKMQSLSHEFEPGMIDFAIFSFTEKTIDETVELFYQKVKEMVQ